MDELFKDLYYNLLKRREQIKTMGNDIYLKDLGTKWIKASILSQDVFSFVFKYAVERDEQLI